MFVLLLDRIIPKSFCFGCPKMSSFNIAFLKGKLFIFVQPLKASLDIFSMLIPPLMLSNFVHPLNAHSSIETRDFGKINSCNAVQFSNVEYCIISMFGIEILYKLLQFLNALGLIYSIVFGRVISVRVLQFSNAFQPICLMFGKFKVLIFVLGISISSRRGLNSISSMLGQ